MDNTTTFDGRYVYRNQRLLQDADDWVIIWYDERDAWALNDQVPAETYISLFEGICRADVTTPDKCGQCWEFYQGTQSEINCNVIVHPIASLNEADCMTQPVNTITTPTTFTTLCFQDSANSLATYDNPYTGKWYMDTTTTYRGRNYWYTVDENGYIKFVMYYDDEWRYWVIDSYFITEPAQMDLVCYKYDEFEPFNCDTWHTQTPGWTFSMDTTCTLQPSTSPTPAPTNVPSVSPTPNPTALCIEENKYVAIHSTNGVVTFFLDVTQALTSYHTNFPPYQTNDFYHKKIVVFENGLPPANWTVDKSNPCNYNTWQYNRTYYEGNVVLIEYDDFFGGVSCSVQQWTWMFEQYGAVAVLVANNKDSTHVYALSGDYSLITSIPTRMITEYAGHTITHSIGLYNDVIYADFGCFEHTEFPNLVCLTDYSNIGEYVYLDGEYQRQLLPINDHPYYLKSGHYGVFEHLFIWLDIDRTVSGEDSWRWVVGSNFNDVNSIVAECKDNGVHYDHPGLCGNNWYINDTLRATIRVSNDSCVLSDNYVCVDSAASMLYPSLSLLHQCLVFINIKNKSKVDPFLPLILQCFLDYNSPNCIPSDLIKIHEKLIHRCAPTVLEYINLENRSLLGLQMKSLYMFFFGISYCSMTPFSFDII